MSLLVVKRFLHPKLAKSSCLPYDIASRKYSAAVAFKEEKLKPEKVEKKVPVEWEKIIVKKLSVEYQNRKNDSKLLYDKRRLMANTVNYITNGNIKKKS
uniref:Uncharacterized protein n=1 Tax=Panagrolaimus superbus TaxID=310955 RepID=A0A914YX93_9BILA